MTLKSEDESTPGSEGWPFLRMHYIKVCDPVPLSRFHCPGSQSVTHLHVTPVCGVSGWWVWGALYWKHLLTLAASITSTSVGDHLVLKHCNCQEGKY